MWPIGCALIFLFSLLINPKTRFLKVIKEQFGIYINDRNGKYYWLDFICFLGVPVLLAVIIALKMPLSIIVRYADTIVTVFSLIATLPLSFLALLIDKILDSKKEKEVAKETFVSITLDIIYSMVVIAVVIIAALCNVSSVIEQILVGVIAFFVVKIAMNIIMIMKRVFSIWER